MWYEINVSKNGKHFFATAERSITNGDKCNEVLSILRFKFPKNEGYEITVTKYETVGIPLDFC